MSLSPEQTKALSAPLQLQHVKQRKQAGRGVSYIESWHAESEANRIFGFDGWDSLIMDLRLVSERETVIGKGGQYEKPGWAVSYVCTVRVPVWNGERMVLRDGVGAGHGIDADLGQAHESAVKEAASDAEKRALKTWGNQFGLALYDKTQSNVTTDRTPPPAQIEGVVTGRQLQEAQARPDYDPEPPPGSNRLSSFEAKRQGIGLAVKKIIDEASAKELDIWEKNFDRNTAHLPLSWLPMFRERIELRREELNAPPVEAAEEMDAAFQATMGPASAGPVAGSERQDRATAA